MTEEAEEGTYLCYNKAKKPRVSFDEFLGATNARVLSVSDPEYVDNVKKEVSDGGETVRRDSVSTRVLVERCSRYFESVKEELGEEFELVIDAELVTVSKIEKMDGGEVEEVKPLTGISSNTLHAPLKHEGSDLDGSVKKEYDMVDQKPKLVKPISSVPPAVEKMDDGEVKESKPFTGISSNTLRAPSKLEGSVLEGCVKKEYDMMDEKPKLVKPISSVPPSSGYGSGLSKKGQRVVEDRKVSLEWIETGEFEEEVDWLLVGRTMITRLSTTKGRKLEDNEIVHFAFPNGEVRSKSSYWANSRAANAASRIVRFSTKRSGEIGRLPMEWSKCLIPLVNSKKVKVLGRCVAAPANLSMVQEIMLYIRSGMPRAYDFLI